MHRCFRGCGPYDLGVRDDLDKSRQLFVDVPILVPSTILHVLRYRVIDEEVCHVESVGDPLAVLLSSTRVAIHKFLYGLPSRISVFLGVKAFETDFGLTNYTNEDERLAIDPPQELDFGGVTDRVNDIGTPGAARSDRTVAWIYRPLLFSAQPPDALNSPSSNDSVVASGSHLVA
jgi:hypothetical protein